MSIHNSIDQHVELLAVLLPKAGLTMVAAESCTGGMIAQSITNLAGSSSWFDCGFVTYSNQSKQLLLDVCPDTLAKYGAVSEEVVAAMAQGAINNSGADVAVAVSGIAGPDGGDNIKPVGTVYIAWLKKHGEPLVGKFNFNGGRADVRFQAVLAALKGVVNLVEKT